MDRDQGSILEDAQLIGKRMDFDQPAPGRVRDAVGVAADADHALARDAALQLQHRAERSQRQWPQMLSFFGEGFVDHAQRRGMNSRIGDGIQPMPELGIEIIEIAEGARQEEVLADVAERPARPCPWSWHDKAGTLWGESRNGERDRQALDCRRCPLSVPHR
jgi:hypothetical protein